MKTLNTNPLVKLKPAIANILNNSQISQRNLEETRLLVARYVTKNNIPVNLVAILSDYSAYIQSKQHKIKVRP